MMLCSMHAPTAGHMAAHYSSNLPPVAAAALLPLLRLLCRLIGAEPTYLKTIH